MLQKKQLTLAVRAALGLTTVVMSMPLFAQSSQNQLEEIVVTGSRIMKANLVTSSPVTQLDAEQLSMTGITRLEDVMKDLPQVYQSQGTGQSNGATGTATINLRNLGDNRTLVLVDGKRMPQGSPIQGGDGADINQIPGGLISRVEVLTGGASSTYGSDAVAGVVNFIMVDDFEGVKLDVQTSRYRHDNDGNVTAKLAKAKGFGVASGTEMDGDIDDLTFIIGGNLNEGRGNVVAYATYRDVEALTQEARDYSACALGGGVASCAGSGTIPEGRITDFENFDYKVQGNQFVPRAGTLYNYGPLNYWQRPDERYTAGAFAHYDVNEHVTAYTQLMFMDDRTVSQIAPSGNFFVTNTISCENPFLSEQQFDAIGCDGETDAVTAYVGRRNVEGGPRQQDLRHTSMRGVFGLKGDIDDNWRYDVSYQYGEVSMENTYLNDLSTTKIIRAMDAVRDPDSDEIVCRSVIDGSDPSCVPWNLFQTGAVTQDMIDYLVLPLFARGTTDQSVFSAFVAGNLGDYGVKLPSAQNGVDVVFGIEYREENMEYNPDSGFQSGDGAGQGGPSLPVTGGYDVKEFYTEASIPLVEGAAYAQAITVDLGYRYSDYDTDQTADTYKIAASWAVDEQIKFRASYQRAIRAANLREMFQPQGLNLFDMDADPCSGVANGKSAAGYTFEQCARTGVTQAVWDAGGPPDSPANQYNTLQGGNPDLEPEESDTYSAGVVLAPNFIEGLTVSIDYYDIEVEKAIDTLTEQTILDECLESGSYCDQIVRGAAGSLWVGTSGYVVATNINLASFRVKGWDIVADYEFDIGEWGTLSFNNTMGIIDSWDQTEFEGADTDDCAGMWGDACGYPTPDFRNVLRANWATPWDLVVSLTWRHIGEVEDMVSGSSSVDLDSADYFDLAALWSVTDNAAVRLGVNNLLDTEPEIAGSNAGPSINGNGNTFPGLYDALGQYLFVGATLSF